MSLSIKPRSSSFTETIRHYATPTNVALTALAVAIIYQLAQSLMYTPPPPPDSKNDLPKTPPSISSSNTETSPTQPRPGPPPLEYFGGPSPHQDIVVRIFGTRQKHELTLAEFYSQSRNPPPILFTSTAPQSQGNPLAIKQTATK